MSKRSKRAISFSIADTSGNRGPIWKCVTDSGVGKSDVYLTCPSLRGALKASLHQTGQWHIAYSKEFFGNNIDAFVDNPRGRFVAKWSRPPEIAPGVTLAFRIFTPSSTVNIPIAERDKNKNIFWIPAPAPGDAVEIDILITSPDTRVSDWPGKNSMNTRLVGCMLLDSGETIWVVYMVINSPNFRSIFKDMRTRPRYFKGRSIDDLAGEGVRVLGFRREEDGSYLILDTALASDKR